MAKTKEAPFDRTQTLLAGLSSDPAAPETSSPPPESPPPVETPEVTPDTTAVPEPTPVTTPETATPPATPAESAYLAKVKELGFTDVTDEQEALNRLFESYRQREQQLQQLQTEYQRAQPFVQYGQQYLQQLQNPNFQQFQAQQQAPQPRATEEDPTKWWNIPTYDPSLVNKYQEIVVDPVSGEKRLDWKANTPAEVRAQVEAHNAYREKWAEELVSNPQKALEPFKKEVLFEARKMVDELLGTTTQQSQVEQFAERIKQENESWMFERDQRTGGVLTDPVSGQPMWSQAGQMAMRYIQRAEQVGIQNPHEQWNYAVAMLNATSAQQQAAVQQATVPQQQAPPPAQVAADKKQELLQRGRAAGAGAIPSRNGSSPPAEADQKKTRAQNKNLSPGQQLLADMRQAGTA